jgi:hypothetical protein
MQYFGLPKALSPALVDWLPLTIIVLTTLSVSIAFLWPSPIEFPMDDAYIHFVYARNLAERGELIFNTSGEKGVGTSSLLWVLLLAGGNRLGLSLHLLAKILGVAVLLTLGMGLYLLLRTYFQPWLALTASLFILLSGHMLWFALSGMETVLFMALGMLAILCYRDKHWKWLGFMLGLMVLTRVEGILLATVIGVVDIRRQKAIRHGLLLAGVICAVISAPWIAYLLWRTGYLLPTSGIGKRLSTAVGIQLLAEGNKKFWILTQFPALVYPLSWILYTFEFVLGGNALPPPYITIVSGFGSVNYMLSIWAFVGLLTVIAPLTWFCVQGILGFLKKPGWYEDGRCLPAVVFLSWMVLHNLSYMLYLPSIGTASRYGAMNHIALWLCLVTGLSFVRQPGYKLWMAMGLTIIAFANTFYWNRVYDANIEHMLKVRIAAAQYLREHIPQSEICAASDVGAIRYFSQRPIVDLGGLIDPALRNWFLDGELDRYLVENGVTCLVLPGRAGTTADGWFDMANELGLSHSNMIALKQEIVFQIDRERWLIGYLPVNNYQATVTIYELEIKQNPSEENNRTKFNKWIEEAPDV